jgi:hypothetical protein
MQSWHSLITTRKTLLGQGQWIGEVGVFSGGQVAGNFQRQRSSRSLLLWAAHATASDALLMRLGEVASVPPLPRFRRSVAVCPTL